MDQPDHPQRPTGEVPTGLGWMLIIIGVIAAALAAGSETLEGTILGYLIAQLGIGLGVLLVSLGYIVRAIWFLPGRSVSVTAPANSAAAQTTECEWCGQHVPQPNKPCAQVDREKMARLAPGIKNRHCRQALAQQGFEITE